MSGNKIHLIKIKYSDNILPSVKFTDNGGVSMKKSLGDVVELAVQSAAASLVIMAIVWILV